ncbi:hypothetical protein GLOIN_2v1814667 [Rhizophagus irregularis DAOM 181602=DAOM 197198]|nr:hypothetical protein GLOIN_2v1814667 [Rhizophagus irregularis DAOM 181602=DAOM 197198]
MIMPGSFMTYLLNLNLSGWKSRKIPPTKMKVETMRNQLSNPIRFIIDHIASWAESSGIRTSSKAFLYQKYLEWCGDNDKKVLPNNIFGKKLSEKNITEYKQVRVEGGKREWQYILDRSKIIVKLREHSLDKPEPSNKKASSTFLARQQREERLRKWAIDHGEDPDIFMTITEKDVDLSREYRDRMMADADVIDFAKENKMSLNDLFYMTRRERLISEEIYLRKYEDVGKPREYVYDDEEWQKNISILQENGMLW